MTNVTLSDNVYTLTACQVPDPLAVGQSYTCYLRPHARAVGPARRHGHGDRAGMRTPRCATATMRTTTCPANRRLTWRSMSRWTTRRRGTTPTPRPARRRRPASKVYFRFVVTNIGNVPLSDVTLSDNVYTITGCVFPNPLTPGQSQTCGLGPITAEVGQHTDTATATGRYEAATVRDSDDANYFTQPPTRTPTPTSTPTTHADADATRRPARPRRRTRRRARRPPRTTPTNTPTRTPTPTNTPIPPAPAIDVEKFVSVDGQLTWQDADTPTGPQAAVGARVYFRFVVTNIGNVHAEQRDAERQRLYVEPVQRPGLAGPRPELHLLARPRARAGRPAHRHGHRHWRLRRDHRARQPMTPTTSVWAGRPLTSRSTSRWMARPPGRTPTTHAGPSASVGRARLLQVRGYEHRQGATDQCRAQRQRLHADRAARSPIRWRWARATPATTAPRPRSWASTPTRSRRRGGMTTPRCATATMRTTTCPANRRIDVEKYVSVDGQATWHDADTPPGPEAAIGGEGLLPLRGDQHRQRAVERCDPERQRLHHHRLRLPQPAHARPEPDLRAGADHGSRSASIPIPRPPPAATMRSRCATAMTPTTSRSRRPPRRRPTSTPTRTPTPTPHADPHTDADGHADSARRRPRNTPTNTPTRTPTPTNTPIPAAPAIDVEKFVSVDGQLTWQDADTPTGPQAIAGAGVYFQFVVTNVGNVTLSNVTLSDNVYTLSRCNAPALLAPGQSYTCWHGPVPAAGRPAHRHGHRDRRLQRNHISATPMTPTTSGRRGPRLTSRNTSRWTARPPGRMPTRRPGRRRWSVMPSTSASSSPTSATCRSAM